MEASGKSEGTMSPQGAAWNRERVDLVKRTICPRGISEDEFALFIEQCKRSGLDPLLKEAFCVARRQNIGNRERPNWVTKYEFQPSEAGMLARAERFPDFKGIQASAVFAEDEIVVDQGKGEVVHRFNPAKRKGALVGAWSRVVREGKLPVVVWLDFSGYVQQTPLWAKIPTTMIEKCARVAALRKAYPEAFGGLYVREEMPAEEYDAHGAGPGLHEEPAPASGSYEVLGSRPGPVKASFPTLAPAPVPAEAPKAAEAARAPEKEEPRLDVDVPLAPAKTAAAVPVAQTPERPKASAVVVAFGPHKGKTTSELSDDELSETIDLAHEKLMEQPRAKWAKAMRENLTALEAETELRCRVPTAKDGAANPEA
ncbi:phage recombination protein Bet [Corallococcus aberystwythensis]|uniref:Phage recombination protein Bet n=1 Tax=Corallococcus aberystwythensis TaxID=2316722 RepID=A0A3A8PYG2_9BACT|nr:phage recombination protein Bet [Corallococcus aberystwythensis]RKH61509.1 phage recombination protein Bet [Corallococcus aberystwythensis]